MANFIVAIELGSSKITGIAGRKKKTAALMSWLSSQRMLPPAFKEVMSII